MLYLLCIPACYPTITSTSAIIVLWSLRILYSLYICMCAIIRSMYCMHTYHTNAHHDINKHNADYGDTWAILNLFTMCKNKRKSTQKFFVWIDTPPSPPSCDCWLVSRKYGSTTYSQHYMRFLFTAAVCIVILWSEKLVKRCVTGQVYF